MGWDGVMGVVGNARKGEMGSGLVLLPASRTLKSRCLPQSGLSGEGTALCVLRLLPCKRTHGSPSGIRLSKEHCLPGGEGGAELSSLQADTSRSQAVRSFYQLSWKRPGTEEKQIYVCVSILCHLLAALAPEALPALPGHGDGLGEPVHQSLPNTCWEPVSSHPGSPRLIAV